MIPRVVASTDFESTVATLFLDVALVVVTARLMGALFRRLRQPPVVGEILAGIVLGPTVLGAFPGNLPETLFPLEVRPHLAVLAQLGLIMFMFIVGLELDLGLIKGKERTAAGISITSVALPFGLGILLASWLYREHSVVEGADVAFLPFALFLGASMSVTAFPVLARILTERGMHRTQVGTLALASAAVDDILAWSLLAVVLAVVASDGIAGVPLILLESAVFAAVMFKLVRPRLTVLIERHRRAGRLTPGILAVILVGILVSSWITSLIGIHSIFGAFVFGAILPREQGHALTADVLVQLENVTVLLLLPIFFVVTGLAVDIGGLGADGLTDLALVVVVAVAGKFLGATGAARVAGVRLRRAAAIGTLMNTRGLTELVLLNIGREKGVLSEELFTSLVVMAIVTTVMTEPLLRLFYPDRLLARDIAEADRAALGMTDVYRVLVAVDDLDDADALYAVSSALAAPEPRAEIVLSRLVPTAAAVEVGSGLTVGLAHVADAMDHLGRLPRWREDLNVVVLAQLSADPDGDLARQAAATEADVLVVAARRSSAAEVPEGPCDRLMLLPSAVGWTGHLTDDTEAAGDRPPWTSRGPVALVASDDLDGAAAAEMAVRLAHAGASSVVVLPGPARRATRLADVLRRTGRDVAVVGDENSMASPAIVVAGLVSLRADGAELLSRFACPVLAVASRPGGERPGSDLLDRLERVRT